MSDERRPEADEEPRASLSLCDWRHRTAAIYAEVRATPGREGWRHWIESRNDLFAHHIQSPLPDEDRDRFPGLDSFDYDPALRFEAEVAPTEEQTIRLPHSGDGFTPAHSFGAVTIPIAETEVTLTLYWLDEYGGGVFLPFRDGTAGSETYGGGRYLLDTAKGADLGRAQDRVILDFNFAYHPSCVYDYRWSCPLAPPLNRFDAPIRAGERLPG